MITGRNLIILSSIEWDFLWQGHQEIAARAARAGNRVLFVENLGIRSPKLRDLRRVLNRVKRWGSAQVSGGLREVEPSLWVTTPMVLPPLGGGLQRFVNRRFFLPRLHRVVESLGMEDPIVWTFLPTDTVLDFINTMVPRWKPTVVYYCIADFTELATKPRRVQETERGLLKRADLVLAQNQPLADRCKEHHGEVHIFPFGVNLDTFSMNARPTRVDNNKPVVGYIGGVHRHIDIGLLERACGQRNDWEWHFVGPVQTPTGRLAELPNVRFLGQKTHAELGELIAGFDACIVPYVRSSYTETVVPTKINEYLAAGKPVVATALPSVKEFNETHGVLSLTSNDPEAFIAAIEDEMLRDSEEAADKRRAVARLSDWSTRMDEMSRLIEG